jgi:hypothetical protein
MRMTRSSTSVKERKKNNLVDDRPVQMGRAFLLSYYYVHAKKSHFYVHIQICLHESRSHQTPSKKRDYLTKQPSGMKVFHFILRLRKIDTGQSNNTKLSAILQILTL